MITDAQRQKYTPTIGIECHVQLATKTKLFSGADNDARDLAPNSPGVVSPLCFGLPGTLPVLNQRAVELAIRAGVALNAEIAPLSSFDRKHYFYPDLPKGYQITQLHNPIIGSGVLEIPLGDQKREVRIHHAHLEEDAGKSTHPAGAPYSLVDYNRAGTPLIEIVSEADMHSAEEAKAYAQELHYLMRYAGVSEANLYYGNMRFDVNVSVALHDATEWGNRVEVKNLNSFRAVFSATEHEIARQIELLEKGGTVAQETRGWNEAKQKTISQRGKEDAQDYRYFPEADLPPVEVTIEQVAAAQQEVQALLPWTIRTRLAAAGVSVATVNTLLDYPDIIDLCLLAQQKSASDEAVRAVVNLMVNTELRYRKVSEQEVSTSQEFRLPDATKVLEAVQLYADKKISSNGLTALYEMLRVSDDTTLSALALAEQKGLLQVSDESAVMAIVDAVLADPIAAKAVADVRAGEQKAMGFLVGLVMKQSKGQANPGLASKLLNQRLND